MRAIFKTMLQYAAKIPYVFFILVAFVLGYFINEVLTPPATGTVAGAATSDAPDEVEAAAEIWTCSMHPQIRLPDPGPCPICGMDLILAKAKAKKKVTAPAKYACSMNCLPPLSEPGPCPICGMDMVEVDMGPGDDTGLARTLTLSPAARKLAEIQVATVERRYVSAEIRMVGKVEFDETRVKHISAWIPGRLDRLYVDYTGVAVRPGDHLVYLYSPELLGAQQALIQELRGADALSRSDLPGMRNSSRLNLEAARDRLRLLGLTDGQIKEIEERGTPSDHITIYSPMGGIVIHKHAVEGMYVKTGTRIYTIADLSVLWVKLDAYESDLAWLRYGQVVEFTTEAYPGETFFGKIAFIDPVLNARTRTVKVRLNVPNEDGRLKPEMFVRAVVRSRVARGGKVMDPDLAGKWICPMHPEIIKDGPGECDTCEMPLVRTEMLGYVAADEHDNGPPLVIPVTAPLRTGKRAVVYVEIEPGTYQGREITLGPRAGDYYLVKSGLVEGERVVVNGNFKLDSAMQIRAEPSMMSPEGGGTTYDEQAPTEALPPMRRDLPGPGASAFVVPAAFSDRLAPVFSAYFDIQKRLSQDDLAKATAAATAFTRAIDDVDMSMLTGDAHVSWMKELTAIKSSITRLTGATEIEKARQSFAPLSESMIVVSKRFGTGLSRSMYRMHCPMAFDNRGADWLQPSDTVQNPYFGAAMLRCGSKKDVIAPAPSAKTTEDDNRG